MIRPSSSEFSRTPSSRVEVFFLFLIPRSSLPSPSFSLFREKLPFDVFFESIKKSPKKSEKPTRKNSPIYLITTPLDCAVCGTSFIRLSSLQVGRLPSIALRPQSRLVGLAHGCLLSSPTSHYRVRFGFSTALSPTGSTRTLFVMRAHLPAHGNSHRFFDAVVLGSTSVSERTATSAFSPLPVLWSCGCILLSLRGSCCRY